MSSELFSKKEILETRTKPGFLTLFFGRGFIFVQYSQVKSYILISQNVAFFVFKQNDTLHAILLAWRDFL